MERKCRMKKGHIDIIYDVDGRQIVMINDLRFKGRSVEWNLVEECLKEYIGSCTEIIESSEMVYIGTDFPDEYAHSKDTKVLRGANAYAKANASVAITDMIRVATNKSFSENLEKSMRKMPNMDGLDMIHDLLCLNMMIIMRYVAIMFFELDW